MAAARSRHGNPSDGALLALVVASLLVACVSRPDDDDGADDDSTTAVPPTTSDAGDGVVDDAPPADDGVATTEVDTSGPPPADADDEAGDSTGTAQTETGALAETGSDDDATDEADAGTDTGASPIYDVQEHHGLPFIHYARVHKGEDLIDLWISADSIDGVQDDEPLPEGTLLLREDYTSEAYGVFVREKVGDGWWWTHFPVDEPSWTTEPEKASCSCHIVGEDRTITIAPLRRFKSTGVLEEFGCEFSGNTPCPPETYE